MSISRALNAGGSQSAICSTVRSWIGRSRQQHWPVLHGTIRTPRSTRHPQSAQYISMSERVGRSRSTATGATDHQSAVCVSLRLVRPQRDQ